MDIIIIILVVVGITAWLALESAEHAGCPRCGGAFDEPRLEPPPLRPEWPRRQRCRRCGWERTDERDLTPDR